MKSILSIPPITLLVVGMLIVLGYGMPLMAYAAVLVLHEFAHAIVSERLGYGLTKIRVMPYGISMSGEFDNMRPIHEAAIAAAGPLINLITWLAMLAVWWLFPEIYPYTYFIAEVSLFLAVINLIPVFPLDGGRILRGLLSIKLEKTRAHRLSRICGIIVGGCVVATCIGAIILGANYTYATMAVFLIASAMLPEEDVRYYRIYSMTYASKRLRNGLPVKEIMVDKQTTLSCLFKLLSPNHYTRFVVCGQSYAAIMTISETELEQLLTKFGGQTTIEGAFFAKASKKDSDTI